MVRGLEEDTVITPAPTSRELRDRHQRDMRNTEMGQMIEPLNCRLKGSCRCKGADMKLVEYGSRKRLCLPVPIGPRKCAVIDGDRRTANPARLAGRARIRQWFAAVESKSIFGIRGGSSFRKPPAAFAGRHGLPLTVNV